MFCLIIFHYLSMRSQCILRIYGLVIRFCMMYIKGIRDKDVLASVSPCKNLFYANVNAYAI